MLDRLQVEDIYPLTPMQRGLLYHSLSDARSAVYFQQDGFLMQGRLDCAAFVRAWEHVLSRHSLLRTAFVWEGLNEPAQVVLRKTHLPFEQLDWRDLPQDEQSMRVTAFAQADRERGFNLAQAPLMRLALIRLADDRYHLIWSRHHLLLDGWSMILVLNEVLHCYTAFRRGQQPSLERPRPYRDYLVWLQQQDSKQAEAFWRKELAGFQAPTPLGVDRAAQSHEPGRHGEEWSHISPTTTAALQALARRHRLTLNTLLQGAWAMILSRYSGAEEVVFGATTASRPATIAGIESIAGLLINTLPVRVRVTPSQQLIPWLQQIFDHQSEARLYDYMSLADVQRLSEVAPGTPLFQSLLVFENFPHEVASENLGDELSVESAHSFERTNYPLNLIVLPRDGLDLRAIYDADRLDKATIIRLLGHLETLLDGMLADPTRRLGELPLLTNAERHNLLGRAAVPSGEHAAASLPQIFEAQVARTPDATALLFEGRQLSYRTLNRQANQLAHYLRNLGLGPEMCVGLCIERSPDLVVGMLGILKSGAACVPLDPSDTPHHLSRRLAAAGAAAIVTQHRLADRFADFSGPAVYLDSLAVTLEHMAADNPSVGSARSLAMILPSAARPTLVEHGALVQRLDRLQQTVLLSPQDRVLYKATLDRTTAVWEIWWPLLYGATLVIALTGGEDDSEYLWQLIAEDRISVAHATPAALPALLDAAPELNTAGSLRAVVASGSVSPDLRARCLQRLRCDLHQIYVPTEALIQPIARYSPASSDCSVLQDCPQVYILDVMMQPVPVGVFGEIALSTGLARGYADDPAATAQCFRPNPYAAVAGERLFLSGDRGRWLSDGSLELAAITRRCVWRGDVRVDLDVIEAALLDDPAVAECAVLAREIPGSGNVLIAYVVVNGAFAPERLRDHLNLRLPAALRADAYLPLIQLPLRPDGQLDTQALNQTELIDDGLVQRWERQARAVPGVDQAAVVVHDAVERPQPLHLANLLPDSIFLGDGAPVPAASVADDAPGGADTPDRPAISAGPPLIIAAHAPRTLGEALLRTGTHRPQAGIVYVQTDGSTVFQSYAALLDTARRMLSGLIEHGLQPRDRVILQIERLEEYVPAFWACILGGITPVTVAVAPSYDERNGVVNKLYNTWNLLSQPPILTTSRMIEPLRGLSTFLPIDDLKLLPVDELREYLPTEQIHRADPRDVVFFQLTSGSTGIPKCIQETHHGIICQIHAACQVNGYTEENITLNWLPMDHVVPLLMYHVKDVYLGCQQIQARTDMILGDPLRWLDLIEQHHVTHTWSPNFGYKLLTDGLAKSSGKSWDLRSIRSFLNAGEQVTLPVVRGFLHAVAPFGVAEQAMQPAYGMAELCTVMTYVCDFDLTTRVRYFNKASLSGRLKQTTPDDPAAVNFVEVGPPTPGVKIRITDQANQVLREGVIGRLQVQGDVVTPGYLHNPAANQEAFTDDGWFYTGDLGFILDGRLTITGREKEVIIINGANYYCYEIEDIVSETPGVEATYGAAVAVDDPRSGTESIAIFFSPSTESRVARLDTIKAIRSRIVASLGLNPLYVVPVPKLEFPKTTSGKIQRTQLKAGLSSGQFDAMLKEIDIGLENSNTLPDWFYRKVWQRSEIGTAVQLGQHEAALIFLDALGLGAALCAWLRSTGVVCATVEIGAEFQQLDQNRYAIAPEQPEHYRTLLESLFEQQIRPTQILHLWTYAGLEASPTTAAAIERTQEQGSYSLLFLTQALAQQATPVRMLVVSHGAQYVTPADPIAWERAAVLGLTKTIPQELPWLVCSHIDLPLDRAAANVQRLISELQHRHKEREVAYRDQRRLVARLEVADLSREPMQEPPFKTNGLYLISGGMGGIGGVLAKYLRERYDARLILVGRTPPSQLRRAEMDTGPAGQQIQQMDEVVYEVADVCDLAALRDIVARAEQRWQRKLDGVVHLAGAYHERLLVDESRASFTDILRPKLIGTWTLHQLLLDRPDALFIGFSSVIGFFGGLSVGAYAAANSALASFAHTRQGTYCYDWSIWEGIGVSREIRMRDFAYARGFAPLTSRQGLLSLLAGLHHGQASLLIGLDRTRPQIRRLLTAEEHRVQQLMGYFSSIDQQASHDQLAQLVVPDRFHTPSRCTFLQLPALPQTPDGQIDRQGLPVPHGARIVRESGYVAPQTTLERTIAAIWQDVLRLEQVGLNDNFFELGGQSLLMAQVQGKLRQQLQRDISMVEMLRHPTVGALAKHLGAGQPPSDASTAQQDRVQKQRGAIARQKQIAKRRRDGDG